MDKKESDIEYFINDSVEHDYNEDGTWKLVLAVFGLFALGKYIPFMFALVWVLFIIGVILELKD